MSDISYCAPLVINPLHEIARQSSMYADALAELARNEKMKTINTYIGMVVL